MGLNYCLKKLTKGIFWIINVHINIIGFVKPSKTMNKCSRYKRNKRNKNLHYGTMHSAWCQRLHVAFFEKEGLENEALTELGSCFKVGKRRSKCIPDKVRRRELEVIC